MDRRDGQKDFFHRTLRVHGFARVLQVSLEIGSKRLKIAGNSPEKCP
jgi:hypothetical protein